MLGEVPQFISDLTSLFLFLGTLIATSIAIAKIKWLRWVWNQLVVKPLGSWFRRESQEANQSLESKVDDLTRQFEEHREYVGYHLGPNGTTKPIHERLLTLEEAHGLPGPDAE